MLAVVNVEEGSWWRVVTLEVVCGGVGVVPPRDVRNRREKRKAPSALLG